MAREAERTLLMKQNFMELHHEGLAIKEIADKYDLSVSTVYRCLQEIADENKVTRESLLQIVRGPYIRFNRRDFERVQIQKEEFELGFKEAENIINSLIDGIDKILKEDDTQ